MSKHSFALSLLATALLWSLALPAQPVEGKSLGDPKAEAQAYDIASRTMSPFCPGRTLADCPSGKATEWRQDIRAMLEEGKSSAEIQQILNRRAGENLTGAPEGSLGWALPVGLCIGAIAVLGLVLRRIRREEPTRTDARPGQRKGASAAEDADVDEDSAGSPKTKLTSDQEEQDLEERLRRELAEEDN
jgi:cytochrome c-type biogenesis protein CcmH/NrfF